MSKRRDKSKRSEAGEPGAAPAPAGPPPRRRAMIVLGLFALWLAAMVGFAGFYPRPDPIPAMLVRNSPAIAVGTRSESSLRVSRWLKGASIVPDHGAGPVKLRGIPDDAGEGEQIWFLRPVFKPRSSPDEDDTPEFLVVEAGVRPAGRATIAQIQQIVADDEKPRPAAAK
jgi:hypothetical protein